MKQFDQKEKELWADMPDNMKKWYSNKWSQMLSKQRFWPILFTKPSTYKRKSHEDWLNRIWIWDTQEEKWFGKTSLNYEIKRCFIEYEYQKIIILVRYEENNGSEEHRIVVYDFSSAHICDYEVDGTSFFCSMQQQDVIMCGTNYNQIVEIRLDELKCYEYSFPFKRGTSFIKFISSHNIGTKVRVIITETNVYKKRKVRVLVVHTLVEYPISSVISSRTQDWIDVRTMMLTEWTLPSELFPDISVTVDETNLYITGMKPILLESIKNIKPII